MSLSKKNVREWLDCGKDEPGHHYLSQEDIIEEVKAQDQPAEKYKLSQVKEFGDSLLEWVEWEDKSFQKFYPLLRELRTMAVEKHYERIRQAKIHKFFKPNPPKKKSKKTPSESDTSTHSLPEELLFPGRLSNPSPIPSSSPRTSPPVLFTSHLETSLMRCTPELPKSDSDPDPIA